ncbi:MAG: glycosyltransferase, partial [Bacteroidota bacterium]|nr:glycosyltransferase [Bacteroidota bacterium]
SEHSTSYLNSKNVETGWLEKIMTRRIAKNAGFISPVSIDLRNAMKEKNIPGNFEVVYNVADTTIFYPSTEKKQNGKFHFLHISTLDDAHKNISGMLRVAARLSAIRNDVEFYFVGDGDTRPHEETAKKLNIYNTVAFFEGTKTTSEVAALMRSSDCFVLFSNYENLPCVITEALACGIPVVSTNVGGIPEHITKERGLLVPARDENALFESLVLMLESIPNGKYDKKLLSSYAQQNFSYEKVSEKFQHLYQRVLIK